MADLRSLQADVVQKLQQGPWSPQLGFVGSFQQLFVYMVVDIVDADIVHNSRLGDPARCKTDSCLYASGQNLLQCL